MTVQAAPSSRHVAQFYESSDFLLRSVCDYVAEGLRAGEAVVVIADSERRAGIARHLIDAGIRPDGSQYVAVDAAEALSGTLVDGRPERQRFARFVQDLIGHPRAAGRPVRVYGEMVALLATDGTFGTVFALEQLWNECQRTTPFSLLCGYPMTALDGSEPVGHIRAICSQHEDIIPAESYTAVADPHEQQRMIAELQQKARRLEAEIAVRKQAEARLQAALTAAEAATRAKAEFLATVSHEVRTPLNAIIGMTGLLLTTALTSEQIDYAETVRSSSESLLEIINDILDFSKLEAGKIVLEIARCDVHQVVDETISLVAAQAAAKGVEVATLVTAPHDLSLLGDAGRLRQILLNLVSNAVKFTETGTVVIRAGIDSMSADEVGIRFEVQDPGIGIELATLSRLFEPFTQADSSTTRRYGGTGLGLAIARRLVESMDGAIGVSSTPGVGSTFWFTVALHRRPLPVITPPSREAAPLHDRHCLVVGLDPVSRDVLCAQLRAWGMVAECVPDAASAVARLRKAAARHAFDASDEHHSFDVIIVDSRATLDGEQTIADMVRADGRLRGTRIIQVGALEPTAQTALLPRHPRDIIAGLLSRPLRQSQLHDCLMSVLAGGRYPQESQTPVAAHCPGGTETTLRLLLAEDNPVNQKVALRLLARLGFHADAVANGLEAIDALGRTSYAAILMDCQMPEMDGYEASRRIRRLPDERSRIPIIALTASALRGDRERCLAAGMSDYLAKPIRELELAAKLRLWAGKRAG